MADGERPEFLASGEPARLIPTLADSSREGRITSIFLASIMAVPPFGRLTLGSLGLRLGKLAKVQCFTEIRLRDDNVASKERPDGLIVVSTGRQEWRAIVEAKSGNAALKEDQVEAYLDLARRNSIDAVITISNDLATLPTHHPLEELKRGTKGPDLFHWSWTYLLTEATLLISQSSSEFDDPEQRYILSEVVRFLRHPSSGVSRFDRMNSEWKDVVSTIQSGGTLSRASTEVMQTVATWHQSQRDVCLQLSLKLARNVGLKLIRAHTDNAEVRLRDDCDLLTKEGQLKFTIDVPDAAAPIEVTADLRRRNVTCLMRISAPQDRKSTTARVNWLVRQLQKTTDSNVHIRANWAGRANATQITLAKARENPEALQNPNANVAVNSFDVLMIEDLAGDFGRNVKFVERLGEAVPKFYEQVAINLRAWVATPPKIADDVMLKLDRQVILQDAPAPQPTTSENAEADVQDVPVTREADAIADGGAPVTDREAAADLSVAAALSENHSAPEETVLYDAP